MNEAGKFGIVARLAQSSGLTRKTCLELLSSGWSYVEEYNKPAAWVSPIAKAK